MRQTQILSHFRAFFLGGTILHHGAIRQSAPNPEALALLASFVPPLHQMCSRCICSLTVGREQSSVLGVSSPGYTPVQAGGQAGGRAGTTVL